MTLVARLVVLLSGSGSNLQAILDCCADALLPAQVVAVISNKADAFGLERARRAGVMAIHLSPASFHDRVDARRAYDAALADLAAGFQPDWVVLAGWMRLLSLPFLSRFPGRVVNLHPALPGAFPGVHAIEAAYAAFQRGETSETGVMVHLVPDEGVDDGPLLASERVPIFPGDSLVDLEARVHAAEHRLLPETLQRLISGDLLSSQPTVERLHANGVIA